VTQGKRSVFRSVLPEVLLWNVMSLTTDVGDQQLRGAYGTHDAANPCQTSTDTEYRCFSVVPCQVVNWRLLAVVSWHALEA
jgi:hypothetical protein